MVKAWPSYMNVLCIFCTITPAVLLKFKCSVVEPLGIFAVSVLVLIPVPTLKNVGSGFGTGSIHTIFSTVFHT
jgi:hypothetical protein